MRYTNRIGAITVVLLIASSAELSMAHRRARLGSVKYSGPRRTATARGGHVRGPAGGAIGGGKAELEGPRGGSVKAVGGSARGPGGAAVGGGRVKVETPGGREYTVRGGGVRGPGGRSVSGGSVKYSGWGSDVKVQGGVVRGPVAGVATGGIKVETDEGSVAVGGATLYTLPHGYAVVTIRGTKYYRCGGFYYRATYRGGRLVYVRVEVTP